MLNTLAIYDAAANTWRTGAVMPSPRDRAAAAALGGVVHVAGGQSFGANQFANVEGYDVAKDEWAQAPMLPQARSNLRLETVAGTLYALGGSNMAGAQKLDTVVAWKPGDVAWTEVKKLATVREMSASAVCGGAIYVLGGRGLDGLPVGSAEIYQP